MGWQCETIQRNLLSYSQSFIGDYQQISFLLKYAEQAIYYFFANYFPDHL